MSLRLRMCITCADFGLTDSVFIKSEKYLFSCSKHQKGLEMIGDSYKYRSLLDLLFCTLFPEFKKCCFQYYLDEKLPLRRMLSKEQIRRYDQVLLFNLKSMDNQDWEIFSDIIT